MPSLTCSKCGNLKERPRYSYCRKCSTEYCQQRKLKIRFKKLENVIKNTPAVEAKSVCPVCKHQILSEGTLWSMETRWLVANGAAISFSPHEAIIINRLMKAAGQGRVVSSEELCDLVWADDEDGGPLSAASSISVVMTYIRKKLEKANWSITKIQAGYRLVY